MKKKFSLMLKEAPE